MILEEVSQKPENVAEKERRMEMRERESGLKVSSPSIERP